MNNEWIENQIKNFSEGKKEIVANCFDKLNSLEFSGSGSEIYLNLIRNDIFNNLNNLDKLISLEEDKIKTLKSNPVTKNALYTEEVALFIIEQLSTLSVIDIDKILDILSFRNTLVLQGTDDEWGEEDCDGTQQNKIDSTVFRKNRDNSTAFTIDAAVVTYDGGRNWFSNLNYSNKSISFPYKPEKKKKIYLKELLNGELEEINKDDIYNIYIRNLYNKFKDKNLYTFSDVLTEIKIGEKYISVNHDISKIIIKYNENGMTIENEEEKEIQINEFIRFIKVK